MQFETRIRVRVPRSQCREHGVKAVAVPWAEPGSRFALFFKRFAIAVLLPSKSLRQACELPALDWDAALRIMERTVRRGWDRCELEALKYAGIDEKSFGAGRSYIPLLTDLEGSRAAVPLAALVHDKFHIAKYRNEAVDAVRRAEPKELMAAGNETLKPTRQLWLFNSMNFS